jgi:hypothetical protein
MTFSESRYPLFGVMAESASIALGMGYGVARGTEAGARIQKRLEP